MHFYDSQVPHCNLRQNLLAVLQKIVVTLDVIKIFASKFILIFTARKITASSFCCKINGFSFQCKYSDNCLYRCVIVIKPNNDVIDLYLYAAGCVLNMQYLHLFKSPKINSFEVIVMHIQIIFYLFDIEVKNERLILEMQNYSSLH